MNAGDRWPSFRSMVEHLELFALVSVACAALVLAFWFERERLVLRTEVMTVGPKTSLASIRGVIPLIVQQPILPVVGPDGLCGIVDLTGLDVCSDRETAAEVMGPPIMVDSRTSPHVVRGLMRRYTLPALPVVAEDGRVVGMFTLERHPARL